MNLVDALRNKHYIPYKPTFHDATNRFSHFFFVHLQAWYKDVFHSFIDM
ncbi:hypothetical protein HMPREF0666_00447 [Prevotella sp. C561]|nr:hypothetical protein HMPREF0666_00447 [Prevotella sp. C561]